MNTDSSDLGHLPEGIPEDFASAAVGLRFELLRAGSVYGLYAAARRPSEWAQAAPCWHAWMSWMRNVAEAIEASPGGEDVPDHLQPTRMLLSAEPLMHRLDSGALDVSVSTEPDPHDWLEVLEDIARLGREIERFGGVPMSERRDRQIVGSGIDLLAAIENSLILLVFGEDVDRASCAGSLEIYGLLRAMRAERSWSLMGLLPEVILPEVPEGLSPEPPADSGDAITGFCLQVVDTMQFFNGFRPTGAELTQEEREIAVRHLVGTAHAMRALAGMDLSTPIPPSDGRQNADLRGLMAGLRHIQRVLVLTLSANPERRHLALAGAQWEQMRRATNQLVPPLEGLEPSDAK